MRKTYAPSAASATTTHEVDQIFHGRRNLQAIRARGCELSVLVDAGSRIDAREALHVIRLPEHYNVISPILHVVPLQLLAYHTATAQGTDVDKSRNLAKSVTVE